jgi:hypothetical protein
MSQWFEHFKTYLPKYLSAEGQANLFAELSQFPNNIDRRLYTLRLLNEINVFKETDLPVCGSPICRTRELGGRG